MNVKNSGDFAQEHKLIETKVLQMHHHKLQKFTLHTLIRETNFSGKKDRGFIPG